MKNREPEIKIEKFCGLSGRSPSWTIKLSLNENEYFAPVNTTISKSSKSQTLIKRYVSTDNIKDFLSSKLLLELSSVKGSNLDPKSKNDYYRISISIDARFKKLTRTFSSDKETMTRLDSDLLKLIDYFIIPIFSEEEKQDAISISDAKRLDMSDFNELKDAYLFVFLKKQNMLSHEKDILESLYSKEIGQYEFQEYCLTIELAQIKLKIEKIRSYMNSNQKPDLEKINQEIEVLFRKYVEEIEEKAKKLAEAETLISGGLLSQNESKELKKLYYQIAKLLHPDVNEDHDGKNVDLFVKAQAAYESSNLEVLRQILFVLNLKGGNNDDIISVDSYPEKISVLIGKIVDLQNQIKEINNLFPFIHRENLVNLQWIEERKQAIQTKIENLTKEIKKRNQYYNALLLWNPESLN